MTRSPFLRGLLLALIVAATAVVAYTLGRGAPPAPPPAATTASAPSPTAATDRVALSARQRADAGLAIETARMMPVTDTIEATAVLALDETRTARIGSMVEGNVVRTLVEVGDRVRTGALLAELHSHVVHDSWAEYRKAVAERRRLQTELAYARDAEARSGRLLADKAISQQERERATANRIAAEQQLDMAQTEVRRAEEALEHLGITNAEDPSGETGEQIPTRSPLNGVVLERNVTPGTAVTPGMPLFVVSDLGALWALAEVDERHLGALGVNRAVALTVSAYPDQRFPGTVAFVGDTVNPKTRRLVVRCTIPNPDQRLKPGMFATVIADTGAPRQVAAVSIASVQEIDGRKIVFLEQPNAAFLVREVTLGTEKDGWVEVTRGIAAGDRVVGKGSFLLKSELLKASMKDEG